MGGVVSLGVRVVVRDAGGVRGEMRQRSARFEDSSEQFALKQSQIHHIINNSAVVHLELSGGFESYSELLASKSALTA